MTQSLLLIGCVVVAAAVTLAVGFGATEIVIGGLERRLRHIRN
ncbi:MAG: hypothetical protein ACRD2H_05285 [Terriglobales bacterium]